jgi:hypothetical protein
MQTVRGDDLPRDFSDGVNCTAAAISQTPVGQAS